MLRTADIDSRVEVDSLTKPTEIVENFAFYTTVRTASQPRHLAVNSDSSILSVCLRDGQNDVALLFDVQNFADPVNEPLVCSTVMHCTAEIFCLPYVISDSPSHLWTFT